MSNLFSVPDIYLYLSSCSRKDCIGHMAQYFASKSGGKASQRGFALKLNGWHLKNSHAEFYCRHFCKLISGHNYYYDINLWKKKTVTKHFRCHQGKDSNHRMNDCQHFVRFRFLYQAYICYVYVLTDQDKDFSRDRVRDAHRPIQSEFHRPPTSTHLHISTSMQQLRLVNILYYSTP